MTQPAEAASNGWTIDLTVAILIALGTMLIGFIIGRVEVFITRRFESYKHRVLDFYQPLEIAHQSEAKGSAQSFSTLSEATQYDVYQIILRYGIYGVDKIQDSLTLFRTIYAAYAQGDRDGDTIEAIDNCYFDILLHTSDELDKSRTLLVWPRFRDVFRKRY